MTEITLDAKHTLEEFGPLPPEPAAVLTLVGDRRQKWFRP